jgi:cell division protein FtsQ
VPAAPRDLEHPPGAADAPGQAQPGDLSDPPDAPDPQDGTGRAGSRWKAAFFVLAMMAIIAGAAWALLGPSLLVVKSIQVTGARPVLRAEVLRAAGIRYGTPLIRVDTARAARHVDRLTQVQSAQVSRSWPDSIVITVQVRRPTFALPSGSGFALVDRFGVVVRSAVARPRRLPLLLALPGGPLRGSAVVRAAALVLRDLPAGLRGRVTAVRAPAADQVRIELRGGITIVWGSPARPAAKAAELKILLRTHARYYDVSDPGTAVTAR